MRRYSNPPEKTMDSVTSLYLSEEQFLLQFRAENIITLIRTRMSPDKHGDSKKNLKWKIDYLAAQVGEDVRIGSAKEAAIAKLQYMKSTNDQVVTNEEELKQELNEVRLQKLERKLFQLHRELRASLKKSRTLEIRKQIKRVQHARSVLESVKEEETNEHEPLETTTGTKQRKLSAEDIQRLEQEIEIAKANLHTLAIKTLRNKIMKHPKLKKADPVMSAVNSVCSKESKAESNDHDIQLKSNVEARLLAQKVTKEEIEKMLKEIETIALGTHTKKPEDGKRKMDDEDVEQKKRQRVSGESTFLDSIASAGVEEKQNEKKKRESQKLKKADLNWQDPDFDKFYGNEKKNRAGQRQRRKKWEALYGNKAKHLEEEKSKREQQKIMELVKKKSKPAAKAKSAEKEQPAFMHPSWQAKRQQQEMIAKAMSGQTTNKKIVFDDDDD
ncbi:hypothetical protein EC973_007841 [Apophysomyces ossiformis]|uniref:Bud22 domain-containing protein n=1 Tax=Apophysomyces ossiformis TaxID=679940 RepID=A0A8H7BNR1_9FUNG|nr:hypothetical protein EC973_007841 [Apophysomyces ossiformis]